MVDSRKRVEETLLVNLLPSREERSHYTFEEIADILAPDYNLSDTVTQDVLQKLCSENIVACSADKERYLQVLKPQFVGPERLIRAFCSRYYGEVSPLVERKMIKAVLRRHGAKYDLESHPVQEAFDRLKDEGLIRILNREDAYLKMLGKA